MRTVTRTEFKQWQALPVLSFGERENRSPSQCETGRNICPTAPRKTKSCRKTSPDPGENERQAGLPRKSQQS
jgi:hypothetical protein